MELLRIFLTFVIFFLFISFNRKMKKDFYFPNLYQIMNDIKDIIIYLNLNFQVPG